MELSNIKIFCSSLYNFLGKKEIRFPEWKAWSGFQNYSNSARHEVLNWHLKNLLSISFADCRWVWRICATSFKRRRWRICNVSEPFEWSDPLWFLFLDKKFKDIRTKRKKTIWKVNITNIYLKTLILCIFKNWLFYSSTSQN